MDSIQGIDSGKGILKNDYGSDSLGKALKSKRRKLADSRRIAESPDNEEEQAFENITEDL